MWPKIYYAFLVGSLPLRSYCGRGEIPLQKHCELTSHGKFACSGKTWPLQVSSQRSFVLWVILSVSTTSYSYKGMRKSVSSGLKKIQFHPKSSDLPHGSFVLWVILSVSTYFFSFKGTRKSVSSGLKKIQFHHKLGHQPYLHLPFRFDKPVTANVVSLFDYWYSCLKQRLLSSDSVG